MKRCRNEAGSALLILTMLTSLLIFIPVGMQMITVSRQRTELQVKVVAQAQNVARAGLTEALSWFRNQPTQPVRSNVDPILYPYPDAAFRPLVANNDTIDQTTGIVREYQLVDNTWLWAHYELRRQQDPGSNPNDPHAVHDITDRRIQGHQAGEGLVWYIESSGTVYRLKNAGFAFNQAPNQICGFARVATEIRRLGLTLPANCAVVTNDRGSVSIQTNGRIVGGNNAAGLGYYYGTGGTGFTRITGTPQLLDIPGVGITTATITTQIVFGATPTEIKQMADISVNSVSALPSSYPNMSLIYVDGNAVFDSAHPLRGGGVLFVNGNLTLNSSSNTLFGGLIYVMGNATINGPALISGCLIVQGSITMSGSGNVAEVDYDSGILNSTRQQVGQYRENKAAFYTFTGVQ